MTLDELRRICLALPHASEDVKWDNNLTFLVAGKMFAITSLEPDETWLSFKCSPEDFEELIEREGVRPAPYLARAKWVALDAPEAVSRGELRRLIAKSYQLIWVKLPKKIRAELDDDNPTAGTRANR